MSGSSENSLFFKWQSGVYFDHLKPYDEWKIFAFTRVFYSTISNGLPDVLKPLFKLVIYEDAVGKSLFISGLLLSRISDSISAAMLWYNNSICYEPISDSRPMNMIPWLIPAVQPCIDLDFQRLRKQPLDVQTRIEKGVIKFNAD